MKCSLNSFRHSLEPLEFSGRLVADLQRSLPVSTIRFAEFDGGKPFEICSRFALGSLKSLGEVGQSHGERLKRRERLLEIQSVAIHIDATEL